MLSAVTLHLLHVSGSGRARLKAQEAVRRTLFDFRQGVVSALRALFDLGQAVC